MARSHCFFWVPLTIACLAAPTMAAPIHYTTAGSSSSSVRFEGTSGAFEPGSRISLGKFVIDAPAAGSSITLDNQPFTIALRTPAFDVPVPAGPDTASYPTTIESGVLIRGHLSGVVREGGPGLVATFDSVQLGGLGPYLTGHVQRFSFPIPVADVKLPANQLLLVPTDGWDGSAPHSVEVRTEIIPEPSAWAAWGLAVLAGLLVRRRTLSHDIRI